MTAPIGSGSSIEDKTIYEQLCADFRSLNGFLWQTPLLFMTLTGGLWFAVASFDLTTSARGWLMLFAGIANISMILALYRLRYVMQRQLERLQAFDGRPCIGANYWIVTCFSALLLLAAIGSFAASCDPGHWFGRSALPGKAAHG